MHKDDKITVPEEERPISMRVRASIPFAIAALAGPLLLAQVLFAQDAPPAPAQIRALAEKAYMFAYPLVLVDFTRQNTLERQTLGGAAETNRFTHAPEFPDDHFHQVIRPNADTLYSMAWLDLSKEPVMMHVPDTHGRFYLMQFLDAWTETFSVPGKRTTGVDEKWFAIVGPGWKGTTPLPRRATRIDAPTNMVWVIGRTQTNNPTDYGNVHEIQKGYALMPLSRYPDGPRPVAPKPQVARNTPSVAPPDAVQKLSTAEFFSDFDALLPANPPHTADADTMLQFAALGIAPGKRFDPAALGPEGQKAFEEGVAKVKATLAALNGRLNSAGKNGWSGGGAKVGRYGTDYTARAMVARMGLGALPPEDATYMHCHVDASGQDLDGQHRYRIHLDKAQLPPVRAFWSVTMYSEDGYFVTNPIRRFAIGDRDPLKFNSDGSLDLYIQNTAPGGAQDANWLPAPGGKFNLSLRLYWPEPDIVTGKWSPPPVTRVN